MFATTSRWIAYPLSWLLLMVVPMLLDAFAASAGPVSETNRFTITQMTAEYGVRRSGPGLAIDVTERITANFPTRYVNRGIERRLDASYGNADIGLSGFSVTRPDGSRMPFTKRTEDDGDIVLRIGSPGVYVYGRVDYVIRYTIGRGMVRAADRQEIYLDVNGTGWQQPFGRVSATVRVAPDLVGALLGQQACYRGPAGSTTPCTITRDGADFRTEPVALAPRETMTLAVGFAPGTVAETVPALIGGLGWGGLLSMPLLGLVALGGALIVRHLRLRALLLRDDAPIQYTAPDVPPVLAADFLGLPERGAAAQLTQLVLDGHASLTSAALPVGTAPQRRGRLNRSEAAGVRDLRVQVTGRHEIDARVRDICSALFGAGRSVSLGHVPARDVAAASDQRRQLLLDSGLRRTSRVGRVLFRLAFLWLIVFGWVQLALGLDGLQWPFLAAGVLAVLLVVAAVHHHPTLGGLTDRGRRLRDHLAGLHRFVTMAEADRISWLQNAVDAPRLSGPADGSRVELYEPLLPYAIIFGVEGTWRQVLGDRYDSAVTGRQAEFGRSLLLALDAASSAPVSGWQSRPPSYSYWDSRPAWGQGWVAGAGRSIGEAFDAWATSRDDDRGGSWGSSGSSGSWRSSRSAGGSSGGGRSGGGMGGGGGGGW